MSEFKVTVQRIEIVEHPNADAMELAIIGGYRSCVQKGLHKTGDLAVYIPEQAIVPDWLITKMNLEGRLAGKAQNRVKAIRLRGILSQGLVLPLGKDGDDVFVANEDNEGRLVEENEDIADFLGITKWEPVIPSSMDGKVINAVGKTLKYDIENWKNHTEVLVDGEDVIFTEKLHGTWCCFGLYIVDRIVTSKGFSTKGQVFTLDEANANNLYVKMHTKYGKYLVDLIAQLTNCDVVYVLGEIFGQGVQDLHYGLTQPEFRVFDIALAQTDKTPPEYVSYDNMITLLDAVDVAFTAKTGEPLGVKAVPKLYEGPFSVEVMEEYTDGKDTIAGSNIREGIVMRPKVERRDNELGRVILKSVSGDYLTRKGKVTEFQ